MRKGLPEGGGRAWNGECHRDGLTPEHGAADEAVREAWRGIGKVCQLSYTQAEVSRCRLAM